ncbi:MAG: hypothetical protein GX942_01670, partial [Papillibacter sp.]|nr:hypothetical protein [Papillibacter sp.]
DEWQTFEPFYEWAIENGYTDALTIDRKNNDNGYSPDNCQWVSVKKQSENRRSNHNITYMGKTMTLSQWATHLGFNYRTLSNSINKLGMSFEEAIKRPINKKQPSE